MQTIDNPEALGKLIRDERKSQGLTQEQFAALAGVGARFVRELEHGKPGCEMGLTFRVLEALGMRVALASRRGATS